MFQRNGKLPLGDIPKPSSGARILSFRFDSLERFKRLEPLELLSSGERVGLISLPEE